MLFPILAFAAVAGYFLLTGKSRGPVYTPRWGVIADRGQGSKAVQDAWQSVADRYAAQRGNPGDAQNVNEGPRVNDPAVVKHWTADDGSTATSESGGGEL